MYVCVIEDRQALTWDCSPGSDEWASVWVSDWWQTPFPWSYQITEHKQGTLSHPIIRHVARSLSTAHLNGPILTPSLLSLHAIARVICFAVLRRSSLAIALLDFILQLTLTYGDRLCSRTFHPDAAVAHFPSLHRRTLSRLAVPGWCWLWGSYFLSKTRLACFGLFSCWHCSQTTLSLCSRSFFILYSDQHAHTNSIPPNSKRVHVKVHARARMRNK